VFCFALFCSALFCSALSVSLYLNVVYLTTALFILMILGSEDFYFCLTPWLLCVSPKEGKPFASTKTRRAFGCVGSYTRQAFASARARRAFAPSKRKASLSACKGRASSHHWVQASQLFAQVAPCLARASAPVTEPLVDLIPLTSHQAKPIR